MSSEGGRHYVKKNFCLFCLTLKPRLDRHLLKTHLEDERVLAASLCKPRSAERLRILAELRLEGNDIYNSIPAHNPNGNIIPVRRQRIQTKVVNKIPIKQKEKRLSDTAKIANISSSIIDSSEEILGETSTSESAAAIDSTETITKNTTNKDTFEAEIGEAIVAARNNAESEQPVKKKSQKLPLRMICPYCKGYFVPSNLSAHIKARHGPGDNLSTRQILANSEREMGLCHERASTIVR